MCYFLPMAEGRNRIQYQRMKKYTSRSIFKCEYQWQVFASLGRVGKGIAPVCSYLEFTDRKQKTILLSVLQRLVYLKLVDYFSCQNSSKKIIYGKR